MRLENISVNLSSIGRLSMETGAVGLLRNECLSRRCGWDLGQKHNASGSCGGIWLGSNFSPPLTRVNLRRRSNRNDERDKNMPSVEKKYFERGSRRPEQAAGPVKSELSDIRPGSSRTSIAVLMEVEGVLADVHRYGHRQAFNLAFEELGLDCAQWTEAVFADLMRFYSLKKVCCSRFYVFTKVLLRKAIGWPSTLPTNEQAAFIKKVLQVKSRALEKLAGSTSIPLRPGLDKFVDEVLDAEVPLIVLTAYYKGGEQFARLLVDQLGERSRKIMFVGKAEVENSSYGQLVFGEGASSSLDEQLAVAASRAVAAEKQRLAEEVASLLKLSVEIDTSFTQISKKSIATLRAGAEVAGVDVDHCILLASGLSGSQAASQIDMPCVVVRSSLTARAEFPAAKAALDGYGPGSTTLPRLFKFL
ncbi:unnamed protein product [Calypogeia fissa]